MINICKFPRKSCNRKSYHIDVVAVNFPDKKRTAVLNAVCSGLVHGITRPDVIIYKSFLEIIIAVELNKTLFSKALRAGAADKGNTRCDRMPPSRQTFEHMRSISLIFRLAVNYIVQYYRSIRPYNDSFSTGLPRKQIIYRLRFRQGQRLADTGRFCSSLIKIILNGALINIRGHDFVFVRNK